jgi:hypothetical protein
MTTGGSIGSAAVLESEGDGVAPSVRVDGPLVTRTLELLRRGSRDARGLAETAAERVREQAGELIAEIVSAYSRDVAPGEVGVGGSARASEAPPIAGDCPTGLLYGRVQSGKTAAMIVATAMAIDNGFRGIIVLTSNYEKLVDQTASRFSILEVEGPLVFSSNEKTGSAYVWDSDAENIARNIGEHGLVIVCAKNAVHQRALLISLRSLGADGYPALILDDEADQATPDTTTNARSQQRSSAPAQASTTYRLTVESGPTEDDAIREALRHSVYLQVTATPYALLLQNISSPLRPSFTKLLHPGDGYTGGERFFSNAQVQIRSVVPQSVDIAPPLIEVDETESQILEAGAEVAPDGLQRAIVFFLLAAAAHGMRHPDVDADLKGHKFLCHTSPRTIEHDRLSRLIRDFVDGLQTDGGSRPLFDWAHEELRRSLPDAPPLVELLSRVRRRLRSRKMIVVNATGSSLDFGPSTNFMIGGNILGRGLTIDNLLVTYYLRRARTSQMDTMLQHARMYGYREQLMPYTRVFLPQTLAFRFNRIHIAESSLRELLTDPDSRKRVPVRVAGQLRPTRPGVLDVGAIAAYRPGQQVYPTEPKFTADDLGNSTERIGAIVERACGGAIVDHDYVDIAIDAIAEIIESVRTHDEELGDWDPEAIVRVLKGLSSEYQGRGLLFIRDAPKRKGPRLPSGVMGGVEQADARAKKRPVLFLARFSGATEGWAGTAFWHPTLVFPSDMANWVFNISRP